MNIKPILKYPCPETGELFDSLEQAQTNAVRVAKSRQKKSAKQLKEKTDKQKLEQIRNSIRLEAESISEIEEMLNSRAKLLFPRERIPKVKITRVSRSNFQTKNKNNCANISFQLHHDDSYGSSDKVRKLYDVWDGGFFGFSNGGGGTGVKYVSISLLNFPKMWGKYREMLKLEFCQRDNSAKKAVAAAKAGKEVVESPEYKALAAQIQELRAKQQELYAELNKKYYKEPKLKDVSRLDELAATFTI